ncbi:protein transport protein Sec24A-like [Tubulanus polymorphus]|uniref:protein transport protein Sec24A-like n=1 Tax=Tubulanus polymorphus TaxID=672921 RepID=UPI003DA3E158
MAANNPPVRPVIPAASNQPVFNNAAPFGQRPTGPGNQMPNGPMANMNQMPPQPMSQFGAPGTQMPNTMAPPSPMKQGMMPQPTSIPNQMMFNGGGAPPQQRFCPPGPALGQQPPVSRFGPPPVPGHHQGAPLLGQQPPVNQMGLGQQQQPPVNQVGLHPPVSQIGPPPLPGQQYQRPIIRPPTTQQASMMRPVGPPGMPPRQFAQLPMGLQNQMRGPPPSGIRPPRQPGPPQPPSSISGSTGNELPMPFNGLSNQPGGGSPGVTPSPTSSAPHSQRSSRGPSPVPGTQYDAMEGQFSPQSPPVTPQQDSPSGQGPQQQQQRPTGITGRRLYPQMPGQYGSGQQAGQAQYGQPPAPAGQFQSNAQQPQQQPSQMGSGFQQPGAYQQQQHQQQQQMGGFPNQQPGNQQQMSGYQQQNPGGQPPASQGSYAPSNIPGSFPMSQQPTGQRPQTAPTTNNFNQTSNMYANNTSSLNSSFNQMSFQHGSHRPVNLLQERHILPPDGVQTAKPVLPHDFKKVNCNPDVFRCTLNAIPQTQQLLNKVRLPLGILIHPFKDLSQLPVIQSSVIVRCRSCRTYINPFVTFVDQRRWKCNLCFRVNELPDEFQFDPVSKTYGDPQRRPEIKSATIEFIAPSEYMLRPPQPAVYLFVLDVSYNALQTGYLAKFCGTLLDNIDRLPGDSRMQIGFITYDRSIHFYNLAEGLSQPQMLIVSDIDDVFLPSPDNLLANLHEAKDLILDLLNNLPSMFANNTETGNALGAALQIAHKLMGSTGGRVTVVNSSLPSAGPGALKCREDPNERAGKDVSNLGPATDFYKKMALDCSGQQIAVDLFMINSQYSDLASVVAVSKFSGGSIHYYPGFNAQNNPGLCERFASELRRYLTRKVGFESVMRVRCTRGLSIHTFHGNFFVRSTDLLSLPNVNPDAAFGMQMSIEDPLTDGNTVCFQAALLYTSSKGERRIRVHTLCLPVSNQIPEIIASADQQAIAGLLGKMACDRSLSANLGSAREALINAAVDAVGAFMATLPAGQRVGLLGLPTNLCLLPLYILSLLKSLAFRVGTSTKLDERVYAMEQCKTLPLNQLLLRLHPNLYPVHALDDKNAITKNDVVIPQPALLQLSSANIDRHGAYLLDCGTKLYMWVGGAISDRYCQEVFDVPNFVSIQDCLSKLPELENPTSERLNTFIQYLQDLRPFQAEFQVVREDSRVRMNFIQHMIEDRTESTMSYYEFIQHIQKQVKT